MFDKVNKEHNLLLTGKNFVTTVLEIINSLLTPVSGSGFEISRDVLIRLL
jgi:hypothetical protein